MKETQHEFRVLSNEVLGIRDALRLVSSNWSLDKCEEFNHDVLEQLKLWETKAAQLSTLAEKYSGHL